VGCSTLRYRAPDVVAIILALGLVAVGVLIGLALVVNVLKGHNPTPTLGENTTQILTTVMGGLIGVLGSYLGYSAFLLHESDRPPPPDEEITREWPPQDSH
jgi:hypothetical protein